MVESEFAPGPSRPAQDEQVFFAMDKLHRAVDPGDDGVGAGRCTNAIHASIIGVCLGRLLPPVIMSGLRAYGEETCGSSSVV